ncbi:zinc transporter 11-like [Neltuma alba]|uniref:zinc transporter 11-like n=1 Tax=Neltuma alba TaxID=207710 RepID=UPI0010A56BA1|nr:zinc transporter 11-like [Prosopis alba]
MPLAFREELNQNHPHRTICTSSTIKTRSIPPELEQNGQSPLGSRRLQPPRQNKVLNPPITTFFFSIFLPMSPSLLFLHFFSLFFLVFVSSVSAHGAHDKEWESADANLDLRSRTLILAKIWCMIIVFVVTFVAGVSPYVLKWNEGFLVLGTQFAGGVFLGTAMMHFLSDAHQTFEDLTDKEYPFAFMLACVGYLFTMFADCVVSSIFAGQNKRSGSGADVELQGDEMANGSANVRTSQSQYKVHAGANHHFANHVASASSLGDTILLILALCFHSLFEGIAIGVAEKKEDAWRALWTISMHKIFAAIAMGIALLRMTPNRPLLSCAIYSFAFAMSSPAGAAIGIIIDSTTQGSLADWIFAVSMSLACGVFIYVSVNHLLSKGFAPQKPVQVDTAYFKFIAVLLGVGVIAVVMIWDT